MKTLCFDSDLLKTTNRYSASFALPDYPWRADGSFDREAALRTILTEEYGYIADDGLTVESEIVSDLADQYAGKCRQITVNFTLTRNGKRASFPINVFLPNKKPDAPMFVEINFHEDIPNKYCPLEELMDRGIALAHIYYKAVTSDDNDFTNGVAPLLGDRNDPHSAGKIAMWAYCTSLVATYLLKNGFAREGALYVAGHSRLGKTALLVGATDPRFCGVLSNCSGSCGAAIAREKTGETVEKICNAYPYWFCTSFFRYRGKENEMPFDQHYLTSLIAPRKLCIVTAEKDTWADTDAQYLCAEAADVVYRKMGIPGLVREDGMLPQGKNTRKGNIAFSKRYGTHFFSRDDWNFYIDFILGTKE